MIANRAFKRARECVCVERLRAVSATEAVIILSIVKNTLALTMFLEVFSGVLVTGKLVSYEKKTTKMLDHDSDVDLAALSIIITVFAASLKYLECTVFFFA